MSVVNTEVLSKPKRRCYIHFETDTRVYILSGRVSLDLEGGRWLDFRFGGRNYHVPHKYGTRELEAWFRPYYRYVDGEAFTRAWHDGTPSGTADEVSSWVEKRTYIDMMGAIGSGLTVKNILLFLAVAGILTGAWFFLKGNNSGTGTLPEGNDPPIWTTQAPTPTNTIPYETVLP